MEIMNLDNIKTKGIVDEDKLLTLSNSIASAIVDMKFISKENISSLVNAHLKIFYEKTHVAKLGLKIRQLEDNIAELKLKAKKHNIHMSYERDFFVSKLRKLITDEEFYNYCQENNNQKKEI